MDLTAASESLLGATVQACSYDTTVLSAVLVRAVSMCSQAL
jgi:hypothetical protein